MRNGTLRLLPLFGAALLATGCAQFKAGPYAADYTALDKMRSAKAGTAAVATVQPVDPANPVNRLSLRGAALLSPSGTFAKYVEDALIADLKEAKVYDSGSRTLLTAQILKNDIDISGFSVGTGAMEMHLRVTRDGQSRLDKTYKASTTFDSHFMGNIAIPAGQAAYAGLVRELLRTVYSDPQFIAAISN